MTGDLEADAHSAFFSEKLSGWDLLERYPEKFEEAKSMEKTALKDGSPFTWSSSESLEELQEPARVAQIKADHAKKLEASEEEKEN